MCAALLAAARTRGPVGSPPYLIALGIAAVAYFFAIREFARNPKYPRHAFVICLALAAVWRVPFLVVRPGPQDDVLRYVWDGRVQRLGYNPYTAIPADPALARVHTNETREMNNPDVPTPYPAGAQLFSAL
jgi:alpha-1,6-mannosyltransferase